MVCAFEKDASFGSIGYRLLGYVLLAVKIFKYSIKQTSIQPRGRHIFQNNFKIENAWNWEIPVVQNILV